MNRLVRIYGLLLGFYPGRFRREFADEMRDVFACKLADAPGTQRAALLARELFDAPFQIAHAHIEALQRKVNPMSIRPAADGVRFKFLYSFSCTSIMTLLIVTVICAIVPFYVLGMHEQPANFIRGGHFDPKGMWLYQTFLGHVLYMGGILSFIVLPVWFAVFMPLLVGSLVRQKDRLSRRLQSYGVFTMLLSAALLAFLYVGTGQLIWVWLLD